MKRYTKVVLSVRSLSREYLDGLLRLTFDLLDKEQVDLSFDARVQAAVARLKTLHEEFMGKQGKMAERGQTLTELDRLRDMDVTDFRYYIRSQLRHRQEKRRQAAQDIYELVGQFIDLKTQSLDQQTQGTRQLLKALEEKETRAKVNLIGAADYCANLKESQDKFEEAYLQKTKERQEAQTNTNEQAREILLKYYRELYGYLLALEFFDQDGPHRPALAVFNAARLTYQDKVKRKANQAKKKATEEKVSPVPETASADEAGE